MELCLEVGASLPQSEACGSPSCHSSHNTYSLLLGPDASSLMPVVLNRPSSSMGNLSPRTTRSSMGNLSHIPIPPEDTGFFAT